MRRMLAGAAFALLLVPGPAVAVGDAEVLVVNGRGPLTLTSAAAVSYQAYFQRECPLVLAAHASGRWVTATTGPEENCFTGAIDFKAYILSTLANCEGGVRYGECWILAIGRKIVWEGPIQVRPGKWTPKSDRQYAVALAGEKPGATSGRSYSETIGLLTYKDGEPSAEMIFRPHKVLGQCSGALTLIDGAPSPFTVTCSKMGAVTGLLDVGPDGRTGIGAGSGATGGADARHFRLTVLPRRGAVAKQ